MIDDDDLIEVGRVGKAHGLGGELTVTAVSAPAADAMADAEYFVCDVDGIFVPFFVAGTRKRTNQSLLVRFDGVGSQDAAMPFVGQTLWMERRQMPDTLVEELDAPDDDIIGYTIVDETYGTIGTIVDVDDQTENVLFVVDTPRGEMLIPAAEDLIVEMDEATRCLTMRLPEGLVDDSLMETDA